MEKVDMIKEYLDRLGKDDIVELWNEYARDNLAFDDEIFGNDESDLNDILSGNDPYWIICRIVYGDYNGNDPYVKFDGYGNLQSFYDPLEYIYIDELADYIVDYDEDYGDSEIREILDSEEDEEDEEEDEDDL